MKLAGALAGFLVGIGGLALVSATLETTVLAQADTANEPAEIVVCDVIAAQIHDDERNGDAWVANGTDVVLLHSVGCAASESGYDYTEYPLGGGCNAMAWAEAREMVLHDGLNLATDDGYGFSVVWTYVTEGRKECVQQGDGTYADAQLLAKQEAGT